ncbi:MAG: hypothetical protein M3081_05225 [Gemmatimonadota bacterium]|nr:hypothetical protein [Gemmatimonadota bacterium]
MWEERMLVDVLVFIAGTTALISVTRLIGKWLAVRKVPAQLDSGAIETRLAHIEQIVETTALEVERVSEAQRFVTRLLAERVSGMALPRSSDRSITPH